MPASMEPFLSPLMAPSDSDQLFTTVETIGLTQLVWRSGEARLATTGEDAIAVRKP